MGTIPWHDLVGFAALAGGACNLAAALINLAARLSDRRGTSRRRPPESR